MCARSHGLRNGNRLLRAQRDRRAPVGRVPPGDREDHGLAPGHQHHRGVLLRTVALGAPAHQAGTRHPHERRPDRARRERCPGHGPGDGFTQQIVTLADVQVAVEHRL